jgi:hypothetical protein
MCRTSLWGVAGFLACAYFTWGAFGHVIRNSYLWPHDAWTAATYVVWIVLLTALTVDTRCWRERFFFGVLVLNFLIGFGLTVWKTAPAGDVRAIRLVTGVLWALAGVLSLTTVGRERTGQKSEIRLQK